ncbi:MAG: hypothetical protein K2L95_00775 [Alphaproteobacteria bacterium]|nr:hypothetical protein [Alphaproteobacteria bacterium]
MKRKHIWIIWCVCVGWGMSPPGMAAPTAATCKEVFANNPSQCTSYSISTATQGDGSTLYICTCQVCSDGYHINNGSQYVSSSVSFYRANTCARDDSGGSGSGGGTTVRPSRCSTGSLCTQCKGPSVTVNGQMYCGMWASDKNTHTCTASPGTLAAYSMSACCDSDGYAVGTTNACYVIACESGRVASDDRRSCVCDIGYYGNVSDGCTRCPASGGIYGLTESKGKTEITDCYFPVGLSTKDTFGTYQFTQDCYYKK